MAIHLTNDNHVAAFGESKNHLGGISTSQHGDHLVVVRQATNWTNKEFVATPDVSQSRYFYGWSLGEEQYGNQQGGPAVYNDTNTLVTNVRNSFANQQWKSGNCALFSITSRSDGPYANYYKVAHSSQFNPLEYSEYGASVVAYRFDLKRLHFSKMQSFQAYVRCWGASIVAKQAMVAADDGILINGGFYGDTSKLHVKLYESLPALSWNVADGADSIEFGNNVNNGRVVSKDTLVYGHFCVYNPFNGTRAYTQSGNSSRIYVQQDYSSSPPIPSSTNYYHDFQLTNAGNLDILKKNPGEVWLVAGFHQGNGFSNGAQGHNGLIQSGAATVFCERLELVFKCNSAKFNDS